MNSVTERYQNILHSRFSGVLYDFPKAALNKISPNNFFNRALKIILYTGGRLLPNLIKAEPKTDSLPGKIWLYVVSQNNYDALHFLKEHLPEAEFVAGQNKQIGRYNKQVNRLSLRWKFFHTIAFFFPVLWGLYKFHGPKAIRFFDLIFVSIGYYEQYLKHLRRLKPHIIIFSNDHNDDARAMLLAAKKCNIPTIYIQHATISEAFPALQFGLSLLEGQDAFNKYAKCGPVSGKVELIGMPKADKYLQYRNFKNTIENVGISGNLLDDFTALKETFEYLAKVFPELQFTFRPHPGDTREFNFVTAVNNACFSDPKSQSAFEFLQNQDLIIAADSSIHLEAALLNIPGIYYRFGESSFYDYYGYVKNNLITEAKNLIDLVKLLNDYKASRPEVYRKAAYYNATIGTEWEGRSNELAIKFINKHLNSPSL